LLVPPHYDGPPLPGGYYTSAATARIGGRAWPDCALSMRTPFRPGP